MGVFDFNGLLRNAPEKWSQRWPPHGQYCLGRWSLSNSPTPTMAWSNLRARSTLASGFMVMAGRASRFVVVGRPNADACGAGDSGSFTSARRTIAGHK